MYIRKNYQFRSQADGEGAAGGAGMAESTDQQDDKQADTGDQEAEQRARSMGWTPKDEFKGDPAKWRSAAEFVERGEKLLPIVQAQNKRLEAKVAELEQTTRDFKEHLSKTEQRAYERAMADLKEQRKQALAAGDGDAFEKVDEAITTLRDEAAAKAAKREAKSDPGADPVYAEWEVRNAWIKDPKMEAFAKAAGQFLRQSGETATGAEFLELVTKEVKQRFPEKFTNPRRESAQAVEGAAPAQRKGGKTYADMPVEARAACDRMAKHGCGGDAKAMAEFKANFTKQFFEEA